MKVEDFLKGLDVDQKGYVVFGEISTGLLREQCQHGSKYITGLSGYPKLAEGLRVKNPFPGDYHAIMIHHDDVEEFVARVVAYERGRFSEAMRWIE
jgi:hypothetical protein